MEEFINVCVAAGNEQSYSLCHIDNNLIKCPLSIVMPFIIHHISYHIMYISYIIKINKNKRLFEGVFKA